MRLRVKEILLTEVTSKYALDSLGSVGYTKEDAKVAIYHGDIRRVGDGKFHTNDGGFYNVYRHNWVLVIDGVEYALRPDELGNIGTIE